jgi:hypothetical protein
MKTKPATPADVDSLDLLAAPASIKVAASKLRECMVLLDPELGTPLYWIDHRVTSTRNSGNATFMAHNLETSRFERLTLFGATEVPVMVA